MGGMCQNAIDQYVASLSPQHAKLTEGSMQDLCLLRRIAKGESEGDGDREKERARERQLDEVHVRHVIAEDRL